MLNKDLIFKVKIKNINVEWNTSPRFNRVSLKELGIRTNIDNEVVNYSVTALTSRWGCITTIYPKDYTEKKRSFGLLSVKQRNDVNNSIYVTEEENDGSAYEVYYLATKNWVNAQIEGAINASY